MVSKDYSLWIEQVGISKKFDYVTGPVHGFNSMNIICSKVQFNSKKNQSHFIRSYSQYLEVFISQNIVLCKQRYSNNMAWSLALVDPGLKQNWFILSDTIYTKQAIGFEFLLHDWEFTW